MSWSSFKQVKHSVRPDTQLVVGSFLKTLPVRYVLLLVVRVTSDLLHLGCTV